MLRNPQPKGSTIKNEDNSLSSSTSPLDKEHDSTRSETIDMTSSPPSLPPTSSNAANAVSHSARGAVPPSPKATLPESFRNSNEHSEASAETLAKTSQHVRSADNTIDSLLPSDAIQMPTLELTPPGETQTTVPPPDALSSVISTPSMSSKSTQTTPDNAPSAQHGPPAAPPVLPPDTEVHYQLSPFPCQQIAHLRRRNSTIGCVECMLSLTSEDTDINIY